MHTHSKTERIPFEWKANKMYLVVLLSVSFVLYFHLVAQGNGKWLNWYMFDIELALVAIWTMMSAAAEIEYSLSLHMRVLLAFVVAVKSALWYGRLLSHGCNMIPRAVAGRCKLKLPSFYDVVLNWNVSRSWSSHNFLEKYCCEKDRLRDPCLLHLM